MSLQSDAAKAHIEKLLEETYPNPDFGWAKRWVKECRFAKSRRWAFDYAVPAILCAIEIDGGTFQNTRTGHSSGVGLRGWREKHNAAMSAGWRVWHYAPEEIIKAGRKCSGYPDKTQENPRDGYVNLAWAERRNPA